MAPGVGCYFLQKQLAHLQACTVTCSVRWLWMLSRAAPTALAKFISQNIQDEICSLTASRHFRCRKHIAWNWPWAWFFQPCEHFSNGLLAFEQFVWPPSALQWVLARGEDGQEAQPTVTYCLITRITGQCSANSYRLHDGTEIEECLAGRKMAGSQVQMHEHQIQQLRTGCFDWGWHQSPALFQTGHNVSSLQVLYQEKERHWFAQGKGELWLLFPILKRLGRGWEDYNQDHLAQGGQLSSDHLWMISFLCILFPFGCCKSGVTQL